MKIRSGFVSNSSSSSFICKFCDHSFTAERGLKNNICDYCKELIDEEVTLTLTKELVIEFINSEYGSYETPFINIIKKVVYNENS